MNPRAVPAELVAPLDDPAFYGGDPFPHFARLRREAPIAWNPGGGYWALTRHADVVAVSRDPQTFCSRKGILPMEIGVEYPAPPTMMHTDPPDHSRYRKIVQPAFAPSVMRAMHDAIRLRVSTLLDEIPLGEVVDFTQRVAVPFPLMVISDLLGLDGIVDHGRFVRWSEAVIPGASAMSWEEAQRYQTDMRDTLLAFTLSRRGRAGTDVTTVLANSTVDGESLRDDEIVMFQNQLLVAGNETTRNLLSGGVWALAERPEAWARLRADRRLVATAVEEMLRWTSPVVSFLRTATRDVELAGVRIAAGEPLLLLYPAANRDPAEFGCDVETFDVARDPNHHLAFGWGPHFCLGAALARLEARCLLEALLDRWTRIEVAGAVRRTHSSVIAGITSAPIVAWKR